MMASERPGMGPGIERSKSIEDLHHLRLMALLDELVRHKGIVRVAKGAESTGGTRRWLTPSGRGPSGRFCCGCGGR